MKVEITLPCVMTLRGLRKKNSAPPLLPIPTYYYQTTHQNAKRKRMLLYRTVQQQFGPDRLVPTDLFGAKTLLTAVFF